MEVQTKVGGIKSRSARMGREEQFSTITIYMYYGSTSGADDVSVRPYQAHVPRLTHDRRIGAVVGCVVRTLGAWCRRWCRGRGGCGCWNRC